MTSTPSRVTRRPASVFSRAPHDFAERGRAVDREAELDRGRDLVDVLPARAAGADEMLLDLPLVERDVPRDLDHGISERDAGAGEFDGMPRGDACVRAAAVA